MHSSLYPKLELKYCERCGGLWLRPIRTETIYCASCAAAVNDLPPVCPRGNTPSGAIQAAYGAVLRMCATLLSAADGLGGACA